MPTLYSALLLVVLALAAPSCAANQSGDPGDQPGQATVTVDNRSSLDMDLYVRTERLTSPLGFAPAGETTTFKLSPALLAGSALVRFEARPVRGQARPVESEPFSVRAGEEVTWSIPPQ
jgi:hypothetical protein